MRDKSLLSINIKGHLMKLDVAKVMGILNVTPDSFYDGGRYTEEDRIRNRIIQIVEEGADIIDVGGCSTRPGANLLSLEEEWARLSPVLKLISEIAPEIPVSVDTFRAEIACRSVEEFGIALINDISGGTLDPEMWETVAKLHVPYVLMHMRGNPMTMQSECKYEDVTAEVIKDLSWKIHELHLLGVCDVIVDPGFGFAKNREQNFILLNHLDEFCKMGYPILVGVSRKSMIAKTLGCSADESLAGTIALDAIALEKGADIVRVHDVKAAVDTVKLIAEMRKVSNSK